MICRRSACRKVRLKWRSDSGPGPPDADVFVLLRDDPLLALGLDARELQLLAHDLRQLLQRQLDLQRVFARLIAGLARPVGVRIALAQAVAHVALPLPHAAAILAAEPEARPVDLRQRDRDQVLALPPDQLALRDVLAQVLLDLPAHDVAEAAMVRVYPKSHLRSPSRRPGRRTFPSWDRRDPAAVPSPWPPPPAPARRARASAPPSAARWRSRPSTSPARPPPGRSPRR